MNVEQLSPGAIDAISAAVVKRLEVERKKKLKSDRDWKLRNTKLLMKNYHILKNHCDVIDDEIENYADSIFDPSDIELHSIMASKAKTRQMVWYIDVMIQTYRTYANNVGEAAQRRYNTLTDYYIKKYSFSKIASESYISERTVRRDHDDAIKEFSIFLFGIFAIEDLNE